MEMKDIGKRNGPSDRTIREGGVKGDQDGEEEEEDEEEKEEEEDDGFVTCREECGGEDRGEGWNI